ncbi:MAG TPA: 50S ribosomal protein L4 [Jiangellaceae bacterium]|nr:50S ribosomal protein L4 [Jiangellaceae bacterium]
MTVIEVKNAKGRKAGSVELPADVFDVQVNVPLIHQVVVAQLAAARRGTHSTKSRGEVRGGGRKPYRQKGTGRARQGSTRAPQFTGGGIVHGPTPRDYAQRTPKKMKAAALRGALSDRARHGRVHVVAGFVEGDAPSTKAALAALGAVTDRTNVLVVAARGDELTVKSLRNLPQVHLIVADQLNTYDVLCSDDVVFTQAALEAFLDGKTGVVTSAGEDEGAVDEKPADETSAASKPSAEKTTAKKATAKKTTAKKTTTAKKSSARKEAATKATAKSTAAAEKQAAKTTAKKTAGKKSPAKKTEEDGK